jgi:hypothetical protein
VLTAAVQLCSDPRDSQAWFELRRTLLVFLNSNVQGWHHPLAETITVDGSGLDASKHLDAPALHVFRQALAAQIIRLDELPEAVRRELAFRHIAQVGPGSAATGAWTCVR